MQDLPKQLYGNDCGIFMLMYSLYTVLEAQFDFTVEDMPTLRKWWCLLLMETFDLGSYGKLFAHWLRGEVQPVLRVKKRKLAPVQQTDLLPATQMPDE
uniref:Ubiquitin-like protease family profile domain-containing protein n=1 Tax=Knipowitschia caucasica TaxID=637954 RepID=A0AAV2MDB3_KNICA